VKNGKKRQKTEQGGKPLAFRRIFGIGEISRFLEVEETFPQLCNLVFSLKAHFLIVKGASL